MNEDPVRPGGNAAKARMMTVAAAMAGLGAAMPEYYNRAISPPTNSGSANRRERRKAERQNRKKGRARRR